MASAMDIVAKRVWRQWDIYPGFSTLG